MRTVDGDVCENFQSPSSVCSRPIRPRTFEDRTEYTTDRDDVKHLARALPLDLNVLKDRYEKELRPDLGNPRREDLTLKLWIEAIEEERVSG